MRTTRVHDDVLMIHDDLFCTHHHFHLNCQKKPVDNRAALICI